jgi:hypothetical protein
MARTPDPAVESLVLDPAVRGLSGRALAAQSGIPETTIRRTRERLGLPNPGVAGYAGDVRVISWRLTDRDRIEALEDASQEYETFAAFLDDAVFGACPTCSRPVCLLMAARHCRRCREEGLDVAVEAVD